ncbi:MAG: dockerin type I domain-containing protein, partial [Planctomycetota bacterium]
LVGGGRGDTLTGGSGVDQLLGRAGNDLLFSDRDFGSDDPLEADGELLDGGDQVNLVPGDICVQLGLDVVRNCEVLGDGGASKDVLTWLRASVISIDEISFVEGSPELAPFGSIANPGVPLIAVTEPSSIDGVSMPVDPPNPVAPIRVAGEIVYDVNRSGDVTALDALLVINELNRQDATASAEPVPTNGIFATTDVNADGRISALDALLVINELNRADAAPEPISSAPADSVWAQAVDQVWGNNDDDDDMQLEDSELF